MGTNQWEPIGSASMGSGQDDPVRIEPLDDPPDRLADLRPRPGGALRSRGKIPLAAIDEVRPTRNPMSAPAGSLDRLRIDYSHHGQKRFAPM